MGIDIHQLGLLCGLPRGKLLCLGYPDLVATEPELRKLGVTEFKEVADKGIAGWHGWHGPMFDTDAILKELGFAPTYADITSARGLETIVDLNEPLPVDLQGAFDTVFDGGTLEHCFNIGQGFRNVALALKPDGYAVHCNPVSQVNHGFYCISPTLYHDFYGEVKEHYLVWGSAAQRGGPARVTAPYGRFTPPAEASNVVVCRYPVKGWPVQHKYAVNPKLGAAA